MNQTGINLETGELLTGDLGLRNRTPASIEAQVLGINTGSSLDDLVEAMNASDWLLARARSIDGLLKQLVIAWIDHNGEFTLGEITYSVGYSTATKCSDVQRAGHRLLEAVEGDLQRFLAVLVSQPYKPAAARGLMDQKVYGSLFRTSRTKVVNGVPARVLKKTDERFARR